MKTVLIVSSLFYADILITTQSKVTEQSTSNILYLNYAATAKYWGLQTTLVNAITQSRKLMISFQALSPLFLTSCTDMNAWEDCNPSFFQWWTFKLNQLLLKSVLQTVLFISSRNTHCQSCETKHPQESNSAYLTSLSVNIPLRFRIHCKAEFLTRFQSLLRKV